MNQSRPLNLFGTGSGARVMLAKAIEVSTAPSFFKVVLHGGTPEAGGAVGGSPEVLRGARLPIPHHQLLAGRPVNDGRPGRRGTTAIDVEDGAARATQQEVGAGAARLSQRLAAGGTVPDQKLRRLIGHRDERQRDGVDDQLACEGTDRAMRRSTPAVPPNS